MKAILLTGDNSNLRYFCLEAQGYLGVAVDVGCAAGCTLCSPMNGCLSCEAPYFLMLHRDGARQTASCAKTCPRGFFKVRKKRNGFCTKCTMLGCEECLGPHYCSTCQQHYFNYFGKCIRETAGNSSTDPHMSTTLTKTMTKEEEEEEGEGGEGRRRR
ncbi:R-spondin-1-like isoform X4 [Portunus trituberculatus]|uniref:R-spondin-1-like isoform X4 n=1 Tax=Portunus trituberculatus TaxID=210409 RepID=UPI001E1CDB73|nr:R-spondin-1-like isoform X4 [Portunus trituberculatus]